MTTMLTPTRRYERLVDPDTGQVTYHIIIRDALFAVDLRHLLVVWCSCEQWACDHGKTAVDLETKYQALYADTPCSCSMCGGMARRYQDVDICPSCAD